MFFQISSAAFSTFAPAYFISIGFSIQIAGLFASASMIASIFIGPFGGKALDRMQNPKNVIIFACMLVGICLFSLPLFVDQSVILIIFYTANAPFIAIATYTLTPQYLESHETNLGYSMLSTFTSTGHALGPLIIGNLRDIYQSYTISFITMALCMIPAIVAISRLTSKDPHSS